MSSYNGPGTYYIINAATKTAMDLLNGVSSDGTQVNGWQSGFGDNMHQIWLTVDAGRGHVMLLNYGAGTFVSAPKGLPPNTNPSDRLVARVTGNHGAPSDLSYRWIVQPQSDGNVKFASAAYPGKVLDLANSETANGTPILVWGGHTGANQRWQLVPYFG